MQFDEALQNKLKKYDYKHTTGLNNTTLQIFTNLTVAISQMRMRAAWSLLLKEHPLGISIEHPHSGEIVC